MCASRRSASSPEDKGRLVTAFLESFFRRYVEYDFTADLEEQLDRISNSEIDWKEVLRDFWRDFSAAIGETKDLRTTEVLDALNELLGPHIFPPKARRRRTRAPARPAAPASCRSSSASSAPSSAARTTRNAATPASSRRRARRRRRRASATAGTPGVQVLGEDPETGLPVTLRDGRFGPYVQLGERREAEALVAAARAPIPAAIDLETALRLLPLPREVATHPESGEPILAGIGRYGPYVQHGKTYANLEQGRRRAGDRRATAPSTSSSRRKAAPAASAAAASATPAARSARSPATGKTIVVKAGRFGPYVTDGEVNATLPRALSAEAVTLDEAIALINARRAAGPAKKPRRATRGDAKAPAQSTKAGAKKRTARKAGAKKPARKSASA